MTRSSITSLLQPFKVAEFGQYQYLFHLVAGLLKSGTKKALTSHLEPETNAAI